MKLEKGRGTEGGMDETREGGREGRMKLERERMREGGRKG